MSGKNVKSSKIASAIYRGVASIGMVLLVGCSQEKRNEAIDRMSNAAKSLNGGDKSEESAAKKHEVPLVVQEQQRKEQIRQNTEWTPENQKLHPIEYCQAQLVELDKYADKLEVSAHTIGMELNRLQRNMENSKGELTELKSLLLKAKKAYTDAEASGKWPVTVNGFKLSQDRLKQKIIETSHRIKELEGGENTPQNQKARLNVKLSQVQAEQQRVVRLREKVQTTINDLRTKQVIEGNDGISDAISAIADSIASLGLDDDNPSLMDLAKAPATETIDQEFQEIMRY